MDQPTNIYGFKFLNGMRDTLVATPPPLCQFWSFGCNNTFFAMEFHSFKQKVKINKNKKLYKV